VHVGGLKVCFCRFFFQSLFNVHVGELQSEGDIGRVEVGHFLVDIEGLYYLVLLGIVVGGKLVAFEGVAGEPLLCIEVCKGEVDLDLLGIYVEDLFVERYCL